eukprot:COSAG03_NODE_21_length_21000_cov_26.440649_18_plen_62_part_00
MHVALVPKVALGRRVADPGTVNEARVEVCARNHNESESGSHHILSWVRCTIAWRLKSDRWR